MITPQRRFTIYWIQAAIAESNEVEFWKSDITNHKGCIGDKSPIGFPNNYLLPFSD